MLEIGRIYDLQIGRKLWNKKMWSMKPKYGGNKKNDMENMKQIKIQNKI